MPKLSAAIASLALVLTFSVTSAAIGQQTTPPAADAAATTETDCATNRASVQDDPNRRDWDVTVADDEEEANDDSWMTRQQVARVVLYDPANHRGRRIGVTQDTPDLGARDFTGITSSIRVYHGTWQLCSEPNYGGVCRCYSSHTNVNRFGLGNPVTDTDLDAEGFGDTVTSVRLIRSDRR